MPISLSFREGAEETYVVDHLDATTYSIVNWRFAGQTARAGIDFSITPGSGSNFRVNRGSPLNIRFKLIEDAIVEGPLTFTFHVDIAIYDAATNQFVRTDRVDDYVITILDNDSNCFIDLTPDGIKNPVEVTFDRAYREISHNVEKLRLVGDQLLLAKQRLDLELDELRGLDAVAKLGLADAIVSSSSLGISNLGKVLARDLPEFIEKLSDALGQLYKSQTKVDTVGFVQSAALLLQGIVKSAPVIGFAASAVESFGTLQDNIRNSTDMVRRIRDTQVQVQALDAKFTALKSRIDLLASCLAGLAAAAAGFTPAAALDDMVPFVMSVSGNQIVAHDFGMRLIKGTATGDTLELPAADLMPTAIIDAGAGDDRIRFTPVLTASESLKIVAGGEGFDTLVVTEASGKFAWHITADGVVALTPFTNVTVFVDVGGLFVPREVPADGQQMLLHSIERIEFTDRTVAVSAFGTPRLPITGGNGGDRLGGSADEDAIYGLGGNDIIDAGNADDTLHGGEGIDVMRGGAGSDIYYVDHAADSVDEGPAAGYDTVRSWVSHALTPNVERLILLGLEQINGTGNGLANVLIGNAASNSLVGNAGNDQLFGNGGADILHGHAGADLLDGGLGNDIMEGGADGDAYFVREAGDIAREFLGQGVDAVHVYLPNYTLPAHIENLVLRDGGRRGIGNSLDNRILGTALDDALGGLAGNDTIAAGAGADYVYGHDGNDVVDGGTGADVMVGGVGNDTYFVDNAGDRVAEAPGQGVDSVRTALVSTALGAEIESLVMLATARNAVGNGLDNQMLGNDFDNVIAGGGGHDSIAGGFGADRLQGGDGNDVLSGGAGTDFLTGNAGNDTFRYSSATSQTDVITDFQAGNASGDIIDLTGSGVAGFGSLLAMMAQPTGQTYVTIIFGGGAVLYLQNVDMGALTPGDFAF